MNKIYIVIVNWNGWQDTIECLESVLRIDYVPYTIVVVDNGSEDNSLERIKQWAAGELLAPESKSAYLRQLIWPPVAKPVKYCEYDRQAVTEYNTANDESSLILIRCDSNLGFSGGNNIALRYALARNDFSYIWLLNNDTVVESAALSALVGQMKSCHDAGMCGSLLPYYDKPDVIWAQGGGSFNRLIAQSRCLGNGLLREQGLSYQQVTKQMDYIAGASLLVSRQYIATVGLLSEDYFLYFEEPDWSFRGKKYFRLTYTPDSIVYHKVGVSTDAMERLGSAGRSATDYVFRNQLLFTWKFSPWFLPTAFIWAVFCQVKIRLARLIRMFRSFTAL